MNVNRLLKFLETTLGLNTSLIIKPKVENTPNINPFSGASCTHHGDEKIKIATFKREERELFEMAMIRAGYLKKKSTSFITGY